MTEQNRVDTTAPLIELANKVTGVKVSKRHSGQLNVDYTAPAAVFLQRVLKGKRKQAKLTMRDISIVGKCPHSIVGKLENGERQLTVPELLDYCKLIEADPIEIIRAMVEISEQ